MFRKQFSLVAAIVLATTTILHAKVIKVNDASSLKVALKAAQAGTEIELADGEYIGKFIIAPGINGTEKEPIILRGSPKAILSSGDTMSGYGLHIQGNSYWKITGFTIRYSKKGLVVDHSNHILISGLQVDHVGDEGIHLRTHSTNNIIEKCTITYTGLVNPGYGEACYIGSAVNNWEKYTAGKPDTSNYNTVRNNVFGPFVAAEGIDIKEGTTGNHVVGNTFFGKGEQNINSGNSWMEVKGNNNLIENNTGFDALEDGFQVTVKAEGWGANNTFSNNKCKVNGPGFGFKIQLLNGTPNGNTVLSNNVVEGAGSGVANIPISK